VVPPLLPIAGVAVLAGVSWLVRERLEGWAFIGTGFVIVAFFTTLMLNLYPNVLVSSISSSDNLTIVAAASHPYTLEVMSWVALIFKKRVSRPATPQREATNA
jgi:cytochrome d ubiquinol oxidase subunit II